MVYDERVQLSKKQTKISFYPFKKGDLGYTKKFLRKLINAFLIEKTDDQVRIFSLCEEEFFESIN